MTMTGCRLERTLHHVAAQRSGLHSEICTPQFNEKNLETVQRGITRDERPEDISELE